MPEEKVVMYEPPQAASIQTVTGWVGADGRFWGKDEHMARWCGATHRHCEKNPDHPIHEIRSYCLVTRKADKRSLQRCPSRNGLANRW
ncbi:hypothetical protein [Pseudomonas sp. B2021]|uniref:hypothetical protein n=1 Tax=Pseudomonas sp. B2021 TaxID=2546445 RepID=UPI001FD05B5F|nr:hypothetical protein [Pseudomonas sp. B2021]